MKTHVMMTCYWRKFFAHILFIPFLLLCVVIGQGYTQGLQFMGPGSRAGGLAGAFTGAADDSSAIYWNPAGIAGVRQREFSLSGGERFSRDTMRLRMASRGAEQRPDISSRALRNAYGFESIGVVVPLGKEWVGGLSIYQPLSSEVHWDGADLSPLTANRPDTRWSSQAEIVAVSAAVAYRIQESISIGVSLSLNAGKFGFNRYGGEFWAPFPDPPYLQEIDLGQYSESARGWGVGAVLGFLFRPSSRFRIGVVFRTPIKIRFQGEASMEGFPTLSAVLQRNIQNSSAIRKEIEWPMGASLGISGKPVKALLITADIEWTHWSALREIQTRYQDANWASYMGERGNDLMPMFVRDTLQLKLGAEASFRAWAVRAGIAANSSPAPGGGINPLFPSQASCFTSLGAGVKFTKMRVDAFVSFRIPTAVSSEITEISSTPPSARTIWDFQLPGQFEGISLTVGLTASRTF